MWCRGGGAHAISTSREASHVSRVVEVGTGSLVPVLPQQVFEDVASASGFYEVKLAGGISRLMLEDANQPLTEANEGNDGGDNSTAFVIPGIITSRRITLVGSHRPMSDSVRVLLDSFDALSETERAEGSRR